VAARRQPGPRLCGGRLVRFGVDVRGGGDAGGLLTAPRLRRFAADSGPPLRVGPQFGGSRFATRAQGARELPPSPPYAGGKGSARRLDTFVLIWRRQPARSSLASSWARALARLVGGGGGSAAGGAAWTAPANVSSGLSAGATLAGSSRYILAMEAVRCFCSSTRRSAAP